ncbi:phage tail protein [Streptomyces sp. NPDC048409]|uniref:phage tail protein n=1 Tax=Streptomyces sp. NPDC048409 TaxID=3154723 RepID=UPI00343EA043
MKVPLNPLSRDLTQQLPALLGPNRKQPTPKPPGSYPSLGLAMRFSVRVDNLNLGGWSSCRGLGMQFGAREMTEGGAIDPSDLLPERLSYSAITLERAVSRPDSDVLQGWLRDIAARWMTHDAADQNSTVYQGQDVDIRLHDHRGQEVAGWVLHKAYPKEWSGPELNADSHAVALERLTLVHCGFLGRR